MSAKVRDWMHRDVRTVREDLPLAELDHRFLADRVTGFPVVAQDGALIGLVSRSDVIRQLSVEHTWAETLSDYYTDWSGFDSTVPSLTEIGERTGRRLEERTVADVMAREPITIDPDDALSKAAGILVEKRFHRLPVIEKGRIVGILSSLDIARHVAERG
ncbi:MAG: CBS domain-containing protein [Deltaproteobacteria bacterium]|nr:CBS domain-containing protein [Deltaproteobacteria bacterium]